MYTLEKDNFADLAKQIYCFLGVLTTADTAPPCGKKLNKIKCTEIAQLYVGNPNYGEERCVHCAGAKTVNQLLNQIIKSGKGIKQMV